MRNILTNQSIETLSNNSSVKHIVVRNYTTSCEGTIYFRNGIRIQYNVEKVLEGYLFSFTLNDDENYSYITKTQKECSLNLLNFIDNNMVRLSEEEDVVTTIIEERSHCKIESRQIVRFANINEVATENEDYEDTVRSFEVVNTRNKFYIIDRDADSSSFNKVVLNRKVLRDSRPDSIHEQRMSFIKQFMYEFNFIELDKAVAIESKDIHSRKIWLDAYKDSCKLAFITFLQRLLKYHQDEYSNLSLLAIYHQIQTLRNEAI